MNVFQFFNLRQEYFTIFNVLILFIDTLKMMESLSHDSTIFNIFLGKIVSIK
uniref:Uncharacterized protein n=1 Tax=viral metagenome TaxID=1070528 RepID=A0A6C0EBF6_9ZZZZ